MPSPFGTRRSASTYYQYGGVPQHYVLDWTGLPPGSTRAAESTALGAGDYLDISATFHKSLGDYPVAMTMESGRYSVLHSGPEQSRIHDGLGLFEGFSRNEKRLALIAGVGLAGWLAWKHLGKKRRR